MGAARVQGRAVLTWQPACDFSWRTDHDRLFAHKRGSPNLYPLANRGIVPAVHRVQDWRQVRHRFRDVSRADDKNAITTATTATQPPPPTTRTTTTTTTITTTTTYTARTGEFGRARISQREGCSHSLVAQVRFLSHPDSYPR